MQNIAEYLVIPSGRRHWPSWIKPEDIIVLLFNPFIIKQSFIAEKRKTVFICLKNIATFDRSWPCSHESHTLKEIENIDNATQIDNTNPMFYLFVSSAGKIIFQTGKAFA